MNSLAENMRRQCSESTVDILKHFDVEEIQRPFSRDEPKISDYRIRFCDSISM